MKKLLLLPLLLLWVLPLQAQDDLMDMLEAEEEPVTDYAIATFKGTRIVNIPSIETPAGGVLQFLIQHRFGRLNSGAYELFGLDNATIRLSLNYGITDRLSVAVGRSSFEKTYDGHVKYKLLRQSSGEKNMPVSLTGFAGMYIQTLQWPEPERPNYFTSRMTYTFMALLARKFNDKFSAELVPALIHRNIVLLNEDANDVFALGVGGRYKLTGSVALNAEYVWVPSGQIISPVNGEEVQGPLSIGFDIETGGHVFQLHLTNSRAMAEEPYFTETTGNWLDGDIHIGFNISRVFTIVNPLEK